MYYELVKRGKAKHPKDYTLKDIYQEYKKEHNNDEFAIDEKTYRKIILEFNKRIMKLILEDARIFDVPCRLGEIRIKKKKMNFTNKRLKIDFGMSRKLKRTVYHMNDHTDNYYYRFYWNKKHSNSKNISAYSYKAGRINERRLAYLAKTKQVDYFL